MEAQFIEWPSYFQTQVEELKPNYVKRLIFCGTVKNSFLFIQFISFFNIIALSKPYLN